MADNEKVAICIVAYNRVNSVSRLCHSLQNARYSAKVDLIFSIDKSDKRDVAVFANSVKWENGKKRIIEHSQNLGLRKHILGLGKFFEEYTALIVLEDDIIVSPNFFDYSLQCVCKYENDDRIAGISLYNFNVNYQNRLPFSPIKDSNDVYFMNCAQSWGQVWMKKQWLAFYEWYQKNSNEINKEDDLPICLSLWPKSSWLKFHTKYCIRENKYFVYPYLSLSTNNSDEGTHVERKSSLFQSFLSFYPQEFYRMPSLNDSEIKYDGFFEAKFLAKYLGLGEEDLCVDLNGEKNEKNYKRYLLSKNIKNYAIVKSFALSYRPIELNVILNNEGNEIFLYDTSCAVKNNRREKSLSFFKYMYGAAFSSLIRIVGMKGLLRLFIDKILKR